MKNHTTVPVMLYDDLYEELRLFAFSKKISMAHIMRAAIKHQLDYHREDFDADDKKSRREKKPLDTTKTIE